MTQHSAHSASQPSEPGVLLEVVTTDARVVLVRVDDAQLVDHGDGLTLAAGTISVSRTVLEHPVSGARTVGVGDERYEPPIALPRRQLRVRLSAD